MKTNSEYVFCVCYPDEVVMQDNDMVEPSRIRELYRSLNNSIASGLANHLNSPESAMLSDIMDVDSILPLSDRNLARTLPKMDKEEIRAVSIKLSANLQRLYLNRVAPYRDGQIEVKVWDSVEKKSYSFSCFGTEYHDVMLQPYLVFSYPRYTVLPS